MEEFTFKNIKLIPGEYLLKGNHKNYGYGEAKFIVDTTDIDLTLLISNQSQEPVISIKKNFLNKERFPNKKP